MSTHHSSLVVSRRTAIASLGAGGLSLAFPALGPAAAAQDDGSLEVTSEMDVPYGSVDGTQLYVNVFHPPVRASGRPAVLLFHGGGLGAGDRTWMSEGAENLAAAGYVALAVGYRLFGEDGSNPWPSQLDDAQRAVRWTRANAAAYGIDPERIGAFGHSSGGQLAAFLGTRETRDDSDPADKGVSSRIACVVDLSGPMDLSIPFPDDGFNSFYVALLGGTPEAPPDQNAYRDFSPIAFVDEHSSPFLILQGGADDIVPIEHSRRMVSALREAGVEEISGEFPGLDHFSIYDWSIIGPEALAFLGRHLKPDA